MDASRSVLITGATGLVGSRVCSALAAAQTPVRTLSRSPGKSAELRALPKLSELQWNGRDVPAEALDGVGAAVHLAGEPIFRAGLVTDAHLARVRASRVESTRSLVDGIARMPSSARPDTLVCASAVGYYADSGDRVLHEDEEPGSGFTGKLCADWEAEARRAGELGVRCVSLRIGVVMSGSGGALSMMALPFKLGVGGRLGSGRQWFPWIERDDLVALVLHALDQPIEGPLNAVAPNPVRNSELTAALGRCLGRPTLLPVPAFAVRLGLGELADELLGSRRVSADRALESGFSYACEEIDDALTKHLT